MDTERPGEAATRIAGACQTLRSLVAARQRWPARGRQTRRAAGHWLGATAGSAAVIGGTARHKPRRGNRPGLTRGACRRTTNSRPRRDLAATTTCAGAATPAAPATRGAPDPRGGTSPDKELRTGGDLAEGRHRAAHPADSTAKRRRWPAPAQPARRCQPAGGPPERRRPDWRRPAARSHGGKRQRARRQPCDKRIQTTSGGHSGERQTAAGSGRQRSEREARTGEGRHATPRTTGAPERHGR